MKITGHNQAVTVDVTDMLHATKGIVAVTTVEFGYYRDFTANRWKIVGQVLVHGVNTKDSTRGPVSLVWDSEEWPEWLRDVALWCLPKER